MKKIFITGGAGYVGSVLTPYLISKGYEVTVLDLMIYGSDVLKINKNLKIIEGDIRDKKLLKKLIPGHNAVIHLACISNDPSFELNPKLGETINFKAFEPLVKISKECGVESFIYASSSSVYGIKNIKNVDETQSREPLTDYSKFKANCEDILLNYQSNYFTTTIIRPATVCGFGPRQRLDVVVNILTNLAYHKRKILVYGGEQLRPNIHIDDMARVYELLIEADKEIVAGQVFNAGYENQKVIDLASTVKKVIGEDVITEVVKTNDNRSYHISSEKIKKVLGFSAKKTIEDAVRDLKYAFDNKILKNTLIDEKFFNIKRMNSLQLK
tara:strand:+ start:17566 stop:18546 length:981 start_codon:yes stop_codon:yes gene_type:complete